MGDSSQLIPMSTLCKQQGPPKHAVVLIRTPKLLKRFVPY